MCFLTTHLFIFSFIKMFWGFFCLWEDVRFQLNCGEEEVAEEEAMRKSVSPLPGNEGEGSASTTRVFGVPLEEVTHVHTVSGHEVPALVKHIVDYIEEHGERRR